MQLHESTNAGELNDFAPGISVPSLSILSHKTVAATRKFMNARPHRSNLVRSCIQAEFSAWKILID